MTIELEPPIAVVAGSAPQQTSSFRFGLSRLGHAAFVIWGTFTISFVLLTALPGDAILTRLESQSAGVAISQSYIDELRAEYGLDQPVVVQYFASAFRLLTGDLGRSIRTGEPVADMVGAAIPPTLQLALTALAFAIPAGLLFGMLAATPRRAWLRAFFASIPPLGVSVPSFAVALGLMQIFAFSLRVLPSSGDASFASVILPAVTLAIPVTAVIAQVFGQSVRQTLEEGYVATAVATGASRLRVFVAHVFKNSIGPTLAATGVIVGGLMTGTVIAETVFSRPGLGRVTVAAVDFQDLPVVQSVVMLIALVYVTVSLVVDLLLRLLEPGRRRTR